MLKDKIREDLNSAIKQGDELNRSVLRLVVAAISNKEKEKKYKTGQEQLAEEEVLEVVISEAKKRRESITEFEKAGRSDLTEKERKELDVLQKYLPEQLTEEEVRKFAQEAVESAKAQSQKDMGKVMAVLMPKLKGRADGSLAGKIVKELLEKE